MHYVAFNFRSGKAQHTSALSKNKGKLNGNNVNYFLKLS